jgi:hypothetical protein
MATLNKRATVYFDPEIHRALKVKAATTSRTISEIIDAVLRLELYEDEEDLRAFEERKNEPSTAFTHVLKELKRRGKI